MSARTPDRPADHRPEDLADANLLESIREHARWQEPCERVEEAGMLFVAGPNELPIGYRNCAARVDAKLSAREALDRARDFFARRKRGFSLLIRASRDADIEALLPAAGMKQRSDSPCMLIEHPIPEKQPPDGVHVERFSEERHIRDAVAINAEAYQMNKLPPEEARRYFGVPTRLLSERVIGFVAYRGTQPLSTALLIKSAGAAGVYWVGTALQGQRMGLAGLCTMLVTNAGFAAGTSVVTLQASPFGEPVYLRLGYRTYDRMKWYSHPAAG